MKKIAAFLLAGFALLMAACSQKDSTPTVSAAQQGEPFESTTNIRYVWGDSINQYYTFSQTTTLANQQIQAELVAYYNQLQNQLQAMQNQFQQKLQNNGFLTQALAESEAKKIQQTATSYENLYAKREAEAMEKIANNNKVLHDSIMNFIIYYNNGKKYDAILYGETNLYMNPALDITQEVIDGLNNRYKAPVSTTTPEEKK